MNSHVQPAGASTRPALELIALARLAPEVARRNLRALLAADPDHFGKLTGVGLKTVLNIEKDNFYESIAGIGFNPASQWIQSIITLRRQTGYSATDRSPASFEYVRFYLSCDGGRTWRDHGMRAFDVYDSEDSRPRSHAVTLRIRPSKEFCALGVQRVRAILSWNLPPPPQDPYWTPAWGDVAEAEIWLEAILLEASPISADFKLSRASNDAAETDGKMESVAPGILSPRELRELYRGTRVAEHRCLSALLANMKTASDREDLRASDWEDLRTTTLFDGISDIDLENLISKWLNTSDDPSYEELDCIGFDSSSRHLVALINIKAGAGYGGGPSTSGSTEFVAFWIDCGERWEYAGTATVCVHDPSHVSACGLRYSACLPLQDFAVSRLAGGRRAFRVRAVLSWNAAPSTESIYQPVVWGNTLDALVSVPAIPATHETSTAEAVPGCTRVSQ